jgi:MFS family permease
MGVRDLAMDTETMLAERSMARERSSEDARQTVLTSRMLIQSMIIINAAGSLVALGFFGAHGDIDLRRAMIPLVVLLFCVGIFAAVFAGLYLRRTNQAWSEFWELRSYQDKSERAIETQRQTVIRSKRWSTLLIVGSEICFLVASVVLAVSLV